ncbi:hypothetical protein AK812_SmicGene36122 [Symbiodinium microadriaticum]|uniref:Uncharacterized protein n=1 Tax=Symbiodinium microadriaticum TaxID=2951 RepID=A0A1Q9CJQ2_SYMMI|nr:hypothetical protein AK812_SmicGene36122 [Symbiodinium microadriaticum]
MLAKSRLLLKNPISEPTNHVPSAASDGQVQDKMSGARPPLLPEEPPTASFAAVAFPPDVSEADVLLRALAERGDEEAFASASRVLSGWSDSILELVAEVWHWLAASERLARVLSFADHFSVAGLAARLETQQEAAGEAAERTRDFDEGWI